MKFIYCFFIFFLFVHLPLVLSKGQPSSAVKNQENEARSSLVQTDSANKTLLKVEGTTKEQPVVETEKELSKKAQFVLEADNPSIEKEDLNGEIKDKSSQEKQLAVKTEDEFFPEKPLTMKTEEEAYAKKQFGVVKGFLEGILSVFNFQEESTSSAEDKMKINVESLLGVSKRDMLPKAYAWSVSLPETEVFLLYPISKDLSFKAEMRFFHKDQGWGYHARKLAVSYALPFHLHTQLGYFNYPVSYMIQNRSEFASRLIIDKTLFPFQRRASGALLEGQLKAPFYWRVSLQGHTQKRDTDSVQQPELRPAFTGSLIYKSGKQKAFVSYFQQNFSLESPVNSFGLGANLFYPLTSFKVYFRGELWRIEKNQPYREITSFYIFPSLRWSRVSLGALLGGVHHDLKDNQTHRLEYILKGSFYITENIFFTVERTREWDQLLRKNNWSFYLTTQFDIF